MTLSERSKLRSQGWQGKCKDNMDIGFVKKSEIKFRKFSVTFEDVSLALQHWYMKVGRKVRKFMKELVEKSDVTENRTLFSNDRVKDGQRFFTTEGFKTVKLDSMFQLNMIILMLDIRSLTDTEWPATSITRWVI